MAYEKPNLKFGQRIYDRRTALGLPMREIVARMFPERRQYGGSYSFISLIENGKRTYPRLDTAAKLANALEVSIDWLYYGDKKT